MAAFCSAIWVAFGGGAAAQSPPNPVTPPPVRSATDGNGVDLISMKMSASEPALSIGPDGTRMVFARRIARGAYATSLDGYVTPAEGAEITVVLGEAAEKFDASNFTYTARDGSASTLTFDIPNQVWTYIRADGTVARFSNYLHRGSSDDGGQVTDITYPDGEKITYHHKEVGGGPPVEYARIQSVVSNLGYMFKYTYDPVDPYRLLAVSGVNLAVLYCNPTADTCAGLDFEDWPTIEFSSNSGSTIAEAPDGGITMATYGFQPGVPAGLPSTLEIERAASVPTLYTFDTSGTNPAGVVASVNNGVGTWTYSRTKLGNNQTTTVTDPLSHSRVVTSDFVHELLLSEKDGLNRTTTYQYDGLRRLQRITGPEGDYVHYQYDPRGNIFEVRRVAKPGSGLADIVTSATYTPTCPNPKICNKPTSTTDERGGVTDYDYDGTHGGVLTVTLPSPGPGKPRPQTRYSYTPLYAKLKTSGGTLVNAPTPVWKLTGVSTCVTAAGAACVGTVDEAKTTIAYVHNNLLQTSVTEGDGGGPQPLTVTSAYAYDNVGNLISEDGPLAGAIDVTLHEYDAMRRKTFEASPDPDGAGPRPSAATAYEFDPEGRLQSRREGSYDPQSELFSAAEWQVFGYDGIGRQIAAAVANPSTMTFKDIAEWTYDNANRLTCHILRMDPEAFLQGGTTLGGCTAMTPGPQGPDRLTTYAYNNADELTQVTSAVGTAEQHVSQATTYTSGGQVHTLADGNGNLTTFEYDGFNRVSKVRYPSAANGAVSSTTDVELFAYDAASNVTTTTRRGGQAVTSTFDALSRVTARSAPAATFDYDNLGRLISASHGGQTLTRAYDTLDRMKSETTALGVVSYLYNPDSTRARLTWPGGFYVAYVYDNAGALTQIRENGATSGLGVLASFTYDSQGRRTGLTRGNGVATTYGHDFGRLQTLSHNLTGTNRDLTLTYGHNPVDQIRQQTRSNTVYDWPGPFAASRTYTSNGLNQYSAVGAVAYTYDVRGNLTYDGVVTYQYDVSNRLTQAGPTTFAYDALDRLREVVGSTTTRFLYDGSAVIGEYDGSGGLVHRYVHGPNVDEPIAWYVGSGTGDRRWLAADHLGSIISVSDATGASLQVNAYDEYGNPALSNLGRFQFTGKMWLAEAALYHYQARAYSPALGRFMQTDPIGYADGLNLYAYVGNDPLSKIDPLGTEEVQVDDVIVQGCGPQCQMLKAAEEARRQAHEVLEAMRNSAFTDRVLDLQEWGADATMEIWDCFGSIPCAQQFGAAGLVAGKAIQLGSGVRKASSALKALFKTGSITNQNIISIRATLLGAGWKMTLTNNRKGYLFTGPGGESVRVMRRGGGWDVRVQNGSGNYLDSAGNVAKPNAAHDLVVRSR